MAFEQPGAPAMTFNRALANPNWSRAIVPERSYFDGATINEVQEMEARRNKRVGNMTAHDGDRQSGCDIIVDSVAGTVTLAAGTIYIDGDVRPVDTAVFSGVSMTTDVRIGVRLQSTVVTDEDDPSLVGLGPGTDAEGESVGAREIETVVWALESDAQPGTFYQVYFLSAGTVIDQSPPSALSGVQNLLAGYDYGLAGHYIVSGCQVSALGSDGTGQVFSIAAGEANIMGFKKIRYGALRMIVPETFDTETVSAETSTWTGPTGGTNVVTVRRAPINSVISAVIVKRATQVVTRGPVPGGTDALQFPSVVAIESITQGATTYHSPADFNLVADSVSWAPAGAEPASASTYTVTYLYNVAVVPDSVTSTTITLSGGVNGQQVLVSYASKLPRVDLICLDRYGLPVYVPGLSARQNLMAPQPPYGLLKLAEVTNTWLATPVVNNNGTRRVTQDSLARYINLLIALASEMDRQASLSKIAASTPVAKKGIFTDNFTTDFYRDAGAPQTAAVNDGVLQLAVDLVTIIPAGADLVTLPFAEEVIISQPIGTRGKKINPYANFVAMPASLKIEPAVDYWTDTETVYTSPVTQEFVAAPGQPPGTQTFTDVESTSQEAAQYLRTIEVHWTAEGFGAGENLSALTFAGVDVKPAGVQTADGDGIITGSFIIPGDIPSGTARVRAEGAAGSFAEALFVGNGTIDVTTARLVTLISREAPPPVINNITQVTQVVRQTTVVQTSQTSSSGLSQFDLSHGSDPLAQSFAVPEPRQVIGLDFTFTTIGEKSNGVRLQLATMDNGYPTKEVMAEAFINMNLPVVGTPVHPRFGAPIYLNDSDLFCGVIMTDDADHAVSVAKLGDVDTVSQQRVAAQAYTVGDLFSASNRASWLVEPDSDLTFDVVAAKYTATTRTVDLWSGALDHISDIVIRATVDIPTEAARFYFEIVRATGEVIQLLPNQPYSFAEYVTETVTVRAVLKGSSKISPVLYPGTQIICGRLRTSGTYVTKAWVAGNPVTLQGVFAQTLPVGATVAVDVDNGDNVWVSVPLTSTGTLGGGWEEPNYQLAGVIGTQGRLRISLTGNPAARPQLADLRAFIY